MQLRYVLRKQVSRVDLQKDGTIPIGIVLKGGAKAGSRPVIKSIKKGSVAYRSHCVSEKDAIVSVCGRDARGMSRRDFKQLLREAESKIELEIEYHIREACLTKCGVYRMERLVLKLKKESESYGFVLRKCGVVHPISRGYPVISSIKEGGPADRDGRLKAGDRLMQIDDQNLETLTLSQVSDILQSKDEATFTTEYKIALVENSQIRLGERSNLEIDCPDADLGLVLDSSGTRMVIEEVRKGSLADRCGAFRVGDYILSINDIDLEFLSVSKANNLLRSFKKERGRLELVANTERLSCPIENPYLTRKNIKQLLKENPSHLSPECDQQVPSNDVIMATDNTPQSLFSGNLDYRTCSITKFDNRFEIKAIVMLRQIIENVAKLETFIPSLTRHNVIGSMGNPNEIVRDQDKIFQWNKLPQLKILSTRIKNSAHSMAMHLVKNGETVSNHHSENNAYSNGSFGYNAPHLNQNDVIQELMKNLVEIYTKKLISKHNVEKLQLKFAKVSSSCQKCDESCMLAALTIQKILLIVSLNLNTKDTSFLLTKFIKDIFRMIPCENCRISSRSQTGSEIARTTRYSRYLNPLNSKSSSLEHSSKGKIPSNFTGPTRTYLSGASGVITSGSLHAKPSNSTPSILSSQTEFESPASVDGSSSKVSISKTSSLEAISNLDCKGKATNPSQPRNYETRYQRNTSDNTSQCLAMSPQKAQNQGVEKTLHNSSLGFAITTPNPNMVLSICENSNPQTPNHSMDDRESISGNSNPQATPNHSMDDRESISGNSNPQTPNHSMALYYRESISGNFNPQTTPNHSMAFYDRESVCGSSHPRVPDNTRNNSFSYQAAESVSYKDIELGRNGKNYSSSIRKKIFKEKGLLKTKRKNCKSTEAITDPDSESVKFSKSKIQKHSSEPQFLSAGYQSSANNISNHVERDEHVYANVKILDNKRKIPDANADAIRYWSPFHKSDFNDNPNILDIPNWSAKSSHSLNQFDRASNEKTTKDTVDVTLKNEGKGFGLSLEYVKSTSEDSIPLPRVTAVSLQGAAHKIGIVQKGDRILTINGRNTTKMSSTEFDRLKEDAFSGEEILLTIEFDVILRELQFGTFDVCVTKTSKTGLIYNEFQKGSPLVVKGLVKGSPAHRCGSLMPGDEVLYANNIRQEFYDVTKNTYEKSEFVIIRVRRQISDEKLGNGVSLDQAGLSHFKTHDLSRTSIHSNHESNKMFLEQELTLYRDPVSKDFGFLIGRDRVSKSIYVTGIRPNGPADCSKVIQKKDIILQVNGVDLESNKDESVVSLFHPTGDRLELKTRRILNYE